MSQFHRLTVAEVHPETEDTVSIVFDLPQGLQSKFHYQHGQYLTLRTQINGEEVRRAYSICESIGQQKLRIVVKQIPGGRFSTWANSALTVGQSLDVMPPEGHFTSVLSPKHQGEYLLVAAGSGITPIMSIITSILEIEVDTKVTLIYGNRTTSSMIFREDLQDLQCKYPERFRMISVMSREPQSNELLTGRIDSAKVNAVLKQWIEPRLIRACFICGPDTMAVDVRQALLALGLEPQQIHSEQFTLPVIGDNQYHNCVDLPANTDFSTITVHIDGHTHTFELAQNNQSILAAALETGADLPWSCNAGVCSTCTCKVIEGQVHMQENHVLQDDELRAGYVLSCQSYPLSATVILDYDT